MPVQSTPNSLRLSCDRRTVAIALSTVSVFAAALGFRPVPTQSAPRPSFPRLPVLKPQINNGGLNNSGLNNNGLPVPTVPLTQTPIAAPIAAPIAVPITVPITAPTAQPPRTQASFQPIFSTPPGVTPTTKVPPAVLAAPSIPFPGAIAPQLLAPQLLAPQVPSPKIPGSQVTASPLAPSLDNAPLSPAGADSSAPPPPIPGTVPRVVNPYELDTYRLAIGDSISIFVANVPEFTTKNVIMSDGTVHLPVAGSLSLWGMTLAEATQAVTERYVQTDVLRKPFIAVQLLASSPLKIALSGAINRPGAYNIPVVDTKLPTITDAIAFAGGITGTADLKQVKVYRLSPNGTDQVLDVNLWALIQNADLRQDITLRSGDRILLQKAPVQPEEASLIGSANLSPTDMQVGILGEVLSPGLVKVPPNTSLNQALLLVGGFNRRAQVKTVELIRANPDGSVTRRKYPVRWSDSISENANPILQHRDVVLVGSSTLARYGDILSKILSPISQSFSFLNFFNFLFPATK